jgi:pyruvate formate lyase activating enzyme
VSAVAARTEADAAVAAPGALPELVPADERGEVAGRVHSWDLSTGVDGPGTRLVFFLAGCPLRCLYCHNPDSWPMRAGTPTPLSYASGLLRRYRAFVSLAGGGLTISGGEPLQQPAFTRALLEEAKRAGFHTALDTSGFLGAPRTSGCSTPATSSCST